VTISLFMIVYSARGVAPAAEPAVEPDQDLAAGHPRAAVLGAGQERDAVAVGLAEDDVLVEPLGPRPRVAGVGVVEDRRRPLLQVGAGLHQHGQPD